MWGLLSVYERRQNKEGGRRGSEKKRNQTSELQIKRRQLYHLESS